MKYIRITIICMLVLLLSAALLPTAAAEERAEDLTKRCSFDFGSYKSAEGRVLSDSTHYQIFQGGESFSLTWEEPLDGARLCLTWQDAPKDVSILQYDAEGTLLSADALPSFYETATPLLSDARKAVVQAGEAEMRVRFCAVYGAGALPEVFHDWQETPDHLDYLLISTHPDDDVLFLGSIIPTYGAEQGYVGTTVYVTKMRDENSGRIRVSEAENASWVLGLRYYPIFLNMPDVADSATQEKKKLFKYNELLVNIVRVYRQYHPLVVFAQDIDGEYGHWQHVLVSKASREAFALAADPTFDPESAEQYGTWQVQKLFLHLFKKYELIVDAHAPLSFFGGKDAFEVACEAYEKHESQQRMWFKVGRDDYQYAFNRFGMAEGVVPVGKDVFDNIDETMLSSYVPPTPEPTAEPTPEPTAELTPEPTEQVQITFDTPEPVPVPTDEPQTPVPEPQPTQMDPLPLILIGVITVAAAIAVGAAAFFWRKRHPADRD